MNELVLKQLISFDSLCLKSRKNGKYMPNQTVTSLDSDCEH